MSMPSPCWTGAPSDKCFLSHYPPATGDPGLQIPVLCMSHFDEGAQMPSFEARNFDLQVRQPAPASFPSGEWGEGHTERPFLKVTAASIQGLAVACEVMNV